MRGGCRCSAAGDYAPQCWTLQPFLLFLSLSDPACCGSLQLVQPRLTWDGVSVAQTFEESVSQLPRSALLAAISHGHPSAGCATQFSALCPLDALHARHPVDAAPVVSAPHRISGRSPLPRPDRANRAISSIFTPILVLSVSIPYPANSPVSRPARRVWRFVAFVIFFHR